MGKDQVGEVIMGQVLTAATGQNPARQAMMAAGIAKETPALTINAVCGSGLKAVMLAAQAVATGDSEIVVAGGQENMSLSPCRTQFARRPAHGRLEDGGHHDRGWSVGCLQPVPHGHHCRERGQGKSVSRAQQDALALASQQRLRLRRMRASSRTKSFL